MKARFFFFAFPNIVCTAAGVTRAIRDHNQRRLKPNKYVDAIKNTEIMSASLPVLASRGDPADASSAAAPCSSPSAEWLRRQVIGLSDDDLSNFFDWYVYTLPFAYRLFVEPEREDRREYFGLDGEHTGEINAIHRRASDFWSDSGVDDGIHVLCAHGSDLADRRNKLIPTLKIMFGGSYGEDYTIYDHATEIQELIRRLPGGYNFPLLTFNAFATYESNGHDYSSIIIGDGYFEFQQSMGLGSEGPEYVLGHEHAHHLQLLLGEPEENEGSSENDKRRELMADAFSAYFLAHDGGGDMTAEELSNLHGVAYSVGDCEVSNDGHHGTPQERRCATEWGASVADPRNGAPLDLLELKSRFDVWYDNLICLDDLYDPANSAATSYSGYNKIICYVELVALLFESAKLFGS